MANDRFLEVIGSFVKVSNFSIQEVEELHTEMAEKVSAPYFLYYNLTGGNHISNHIGVTPYLAGGWGLVVWVIAITHFCFHSDLSILGKQLISNFQPHFQKFR